MEAYISIRGQTLLVENDYLGNQPWGGYVHGPGLRVDWQRGSLRNSDLNGALIEHLIEAAILRLGFYQQSETACPENDAAIEQLTAALETLARRQARLQEA